MGSRRAYVLTLCLSLAFLGSVCAQAPERAPGSYSSRQAHPAAKVPKQPGQDGSPDLGSVRDGVYRNLAFGISYKIAYGWVQRTESMREASDSNLEKSYVLLAAFERPPEATGDSVNSAVIITAENLSEYPGMDQAIDYFDELDQIATNKGFKVLNPPYEFSVGTKKLARGDYSRKIADDLTMYQGSLVMLQKAHILSFTFIAGSEDELESLIMDLKLGTAGKRAGSAIAK